LLATLSHHESAVFEEVVLGCSRIAKCTLVQALRLCTGLAALEVVEV